MYNPYIGGPNRLSGNNAGKAVSPRHPLFLMYIRASEKEFIMDNEKMHRKIKEHVRLRFDFRVFFCLLASLALTIAPIFLTAPLIGRMLVVLIGFYLMIYFFKTIEYEDIMDRNIIGYNLWFYCTKPAYTGAANIDCAIMRRSEVWDEEIAAVILPLGGWFNRPRLWFKTTEYCTNGKTVNIGWKVRCSNRIGGPVINDTSYPREILQYITVTLTTRYNKERISMPVMEAVQFLDFMKNEYGQLFPFSCAIDRTFAAKVALQEKSDACVGLLVQTAERLEKTKRYVKSKEGAALRQWLEEEIAKIDPSRSANMRGRTIAA